MQALRRSKKTTPGSDGVQYEHIQALNEKGIQTEVHEFNGSMQKSVVPED